MKKVLILISFLLLAACASQRPIQPEAPAEAIWQKMLAASDAATGPYRLQVSMRFGEEGNTRRVTALLWGNSESAIRLDVMAGVGATIAMLADNGDEFLIYTPRDNRAYSHAGSNKPMLKIGVPAPFDLGALAALLTGDFAAAFGRAPASAQARADGDTSFGIEGKLAGRLVLNRAGEPVSWTQEGGAWQIKFAYDESEPFLPRSVRLSNNRGQYALILVKEREAVTQPFDAAQLRLNIPDGVPLLPLSQFRQLQAAK